MGVVLLTPLEINNIEIMADDIDDLLREVEEKYLPIIGPGEKSAAPNKAEKVKVNSRSHSDIGAHEIEDDVADLLDDRMLAMSLRIQRSPRRSTSCQLLVKQVSSADCEKHKCFPLYLSGVIESIDASQTIRICSHLRCTGCDFRIRRFNHFKWRPGTDYLFLRNNMPEFDRVRVKLASAKFSRAYACQCKFVTVKDLVDLVRLV